MRRRAYRGDMPLMEWLAGYEQAPLFSSPEAMFAKLLNLATDILMDPIARRDDFEARERLKMACARSGIAFRPHEISDALRKARGRVRP